jgi:hypothetical protein
MATTANTIAANSNYRGWHSSHSSHCCNHNSIPFKSHKCFHTSNGASYLSTAASKTTEAVFLVVCDPYMNELWAT